MEAVSSGSKYLSIADNSSLSTGGETSFTVSLWVKLNAKTGTQVFASKFSSVSTGEYAVYFENLANRFVFSTYGNNQNYFVYADGLGSPTVGTWYYITATHDAVANTNSITVNGNTNTLSGVAEHQDSTSNFLIGAFGTGPLYYANAVIDEVRFSKTEHGVISNNAPVLDGTRSPSMTSVIEDASVPTGAVGTLVSSLVDFASPAGQVDNVSDVDGGSLLGIAIISANPGLTCFYSINNGASWSTIGAVSASSSRLLAANGTSRVFCRPAADFNGLYADAITFRAWDQTSGTNGGVVDTATNGGTSAFSTSSDIISLDVSVVNDAPVAIDDTYSINQNSTITSLSVLMNDYDVDGDEIEIISIAPVDAITGTIEISAPPSEIGYTPAPGFCGDEQFTYEISDGNGGTDQATVTVHVINCDTATQPPILVSPATSTTYYNNVLLPITFTLPETLLNNSLRLIFTSSLETSFVLNLRDAAPGTNTFNVDPQGNINLLTEVLSTTSNSIPVETYTVTLSYQDLAGNTDATAISTNVTIANPPAQTVVATTSSSSGSSISNQIKNLLEMGNTQKADELKKQFPNAAVISSSSSTNSSCSLGGIVRTLRSGSKGEDVRTLQKFLNCSGFIISSTGAGSIGKETDTFGSATVKAVKALQKSHNLKSDGIFGSKTREKIK